MRIYEGVSFFDTQNSSSKVRVLKFDIVKIFDSVKIFVV